MSAKNNYKSNVAPSKNAVKSFIADLLDSPFVEFIDQWALPRLEKLASGERECDTDVSVKFELAKIEYATLEVTFGSSTFDDKEFKREDGTIWNTCSTKLSVSFGGSTKMSLDTAKFVATKTLEIVELMQQLADKHSVTYEYCCFDAEDIAELEAKIAEQTRLRSLKETSDLIVSTISEAVKGMRVSSAPRKVFTQPEFARKVPEGDYQVSIGAKDFNVKSSRFQFLHITRVK